MLKVIFFGTTEFGIEALELLAKEYNVIQVFTNPPRPAGRGKKLQKTPIHLLADALQIPVTPSAKPIPSDITQSFDVGVVVSFGSIIAKSVLEIAKFGFLNIHPSNLPFFRGAAPIERTLELGESTTKICVIKMTPKLDDGNILAFKEYSINQEETSIKLHTKFAKIGADLLPFAINSIVLGKEGIPQNHALASYAGKITKEELHLKTENLTVMQALNKIRAFAYYGFPFIFYQSKRIKILEAKQSLQRLTPLDLECIDGFLSPVTIKPEGRTAMHVKDFLNSSI